ncbi:MAG: hypothetical protein AB8G22_28075 [Saprospiraceae bacterium]
MQYDTNQELARENSNKLVSILTLLVILVSIGSAVWFYLQLRENNIALKATKENLETANTELKATNTELTEAKTILVEKEKTITLMKDSLVDLVKKLNAAVPNQTLAEESQRLIKKSNNADIEIGLSTLNLDETTANRVAEYLRNEGYTLAFHAKLKDRPTWLARKSSIFYYSNNTKQKANELEDSISDLFGMQFQRVGKGAGNVHDKSVKNSLINIHLIGE